MNKSLSALLFAVCLPASAQVYRCEMPNGRTAFQDRPCATGSPQTIVRLYNGLPISPEKAAVVGAPITPEEAAQFEVERSAVLARMNADIETLTSDTSLTDGVRKTRLDLARAAGFAQLQMIEEALLRPRAPSPSSPPTVIATSAPVDPTSPP